LYRTGDLARFLEDGAIVFLGRIDGQVKLRGFRIELGEIEAALRRHDAVRAAVVLLRTDGASARGVAEPRLVAYIVPHQGLGIRDQGSGSEDKEIGRQGDKEIDGRGTIYRALPIPDPRSLIPELRDHLGQTLPDYMIPASFVLLDALPLTANGKLDRAALPAPATLAVAGSFIAPRTPLEAQLAEIWGDVLGRSRVGIHDDFFALGGHSLRATQVIARLRRDCHVELPLRALFSHPTIAGLARQLAQAQRSATGVLPPPLRPRPRPAALPLSFAQHWLWLLEQLAPGSAQYNIPAAVRLRGRLELGALASSLEAIIARHEALRTTFALVGGQPVQVIAPPQPAGTGVLPLLDLTGLVASRRAEAARRLAEAEARQSFDLGCGPLARIALLRLEPQEHMLLLNVHHTIADGWSVGVFIRELAALYAAAVAGQVAALPALPIQYTDYALWQRDWLAQGTVLETQLTYWQSQLAGAGGRGGPPRLALPTDHSRPPVRTARGATQKLPLPGELTGLLRALSQQEGVTLFMLLLAAWSALLARLSSQDDILIGTPVAGRGQVETEDLIGFFANTLVLRIDLSGDPTMRELLGRVREVCLGAYAHQDLPFERLVAALQPEHDPSRTPLFQVTFGLNSAAAQTLELPGLTIDAEEIDTGTAKFDLALDIEEHAAGLLAIIQYSTDLFDANSISRILEQFRALLQSIAADVTRTLSGLNEGR